jgi:DNA-binding transcriptional regulator YiaG
MEAEVVFMTTTRRREPPPARDVGNIAAQKAALQKLKTAGLTDEQLARVARTKAARVRALRQGTARAVSPRERLLVEQEARYVRDLVEQQEAIAFLLERNMRRTHLAHAVGITTEGLRYWEGGRETIIKRADGPRRARLMAIHARARREVGRRPDTDFGAEEAGAVLRRVLRDVRPARHSTGRMSAEAVAAAREKMRAVGLWPPRARAAKLKTLLSEGGLPKVEWMRRLRVSRDLFYFMLDPRKPVVMTEDVIELVADELRRLASGTGGYSLKERFLKAMTILFGKRHMREGFKSGAPELPAVLGRLQEAMGWESERNARRYLPPFDEDWWRDRRLPVETVEKLEAVAARLGRIA